nr:hypothetical protein GCM10020092_003610 [Actinoplanes digitatis]
MLIRAVLGTLAALTLVIVASALHRMDLYADSYGLTRLRVLVAVCEMWLGLTFVLVLIAGIRLKALWLPRAVVAAGVLALLSLAAANPDRLIADRNVTRYEQTDRIDTAYLSNLSPDAVPALNRLTGDKRACALYPVARDLAVDPDDWRGWNLSRSAGPGRAGCQPAEAHHELPGRLRNPIGRPGLTMDTRRRDCRAWTAKRSPRGPGWSSGR